MKYEYTVMTQVGDAEPTRKSFHTHNDFYDAERECEDKQAELNDMLRTGVSIRSAEEASAALELLDVAKKTRLFVARRPVDGWEECNGWD